MPARIAGARAPAAGDGATGLGAGLLYGVGFRRGAWVVGAAVLLMVVASRLIIADMGAARREEAIAADVDTLVATVAWPHREYLGPRIGVAEQIASLIASEPVPDASALRRIAGAAIDESLPEIVQLRVRARSADHSWTIERSDPGVDLLAVEQRLDEAFAANPAATPVLAANLGSWGPTVVVRLALPDGAGSILEAIRLEPLYTDLFLPPIRERFALQIHDQHGLVWGDEIEPPAGARVAARSFPVAGQSWTVRVWPHPTWLAAETAKEWWALVRVGFPLAPLLAGALVAFLLWWGRLTATRLLAEQRTRVIVERALDAVVSMDASGLITGWNAHAEAVFGWGADEVIGRSLAKTIIPPDRRDAHTQGLARFLATGEGTLVDRRVETMAWHRDGYEFPVEISISPIRLRSSYTFTAFVRDITERKRAEEELRRAMEAAEAANKAKSEFLATMSHEIRTPMNGIFGMTELALDTSNDAERRDFLVRARACAESLMTIINDVLDFSKIEAGKLDLECIEFDVRGVLDGVLDTLAIEAARKQLELVGIVDGDLPARLRGDPGRLRQIIMNLAGNALKFTDRGEIVIRMGRGPAVEASGDAPSMPATVQLRCTVQDTGIGIPPDKQQTIFESFTQADSSTTRRYGGTGLGLAISQRLVTMMGGAIGVESQPGRGSTFWFAVPCQEGSALRAHEAVRALAGLRVLVVDDNATNRMFLLRTLQGWGCRPALASGGAEAFDLLVHAARGGEPFEIVLLDTQMPDLDGAATARRIRAEASLRDVAIVALTSISRSALDGVADQTFTALLPKPIKQAQLFETILLASRLREEPSPAAVEARTTPTILVVDDNEANRIIAETALRRAGYTVHLATGGREAIESARQLAPDLILMDVQMPDVDGLTATAAIRADEGAARRTPIIALTAGTTSEDRNRCIAAGMDGYVTKPLRREGLLEAVAKQLAAASPRVAPPAAPVRRPAAAPPDDDPLDDAIMNEITGRFLVDAIARCEELRRAATSGEAKTVEQIGHYLKGGAAQLDLEAVRDLGAALEALGRSGHVESAVSLVATLEGEIGAARRRVSEAGAAGV
jgi:PAS domain S-box-containing protein